MANDNFARITDDDAAIIARSRASLAFWRKACADDARAQYIARMLWAGGVDWRTYARALARHGKVTTLRVDC